MDIVGSILSHASCLDCTAIGGQSLSFEHKRSWRLYGISHVLPRFSCHYPARRAVPLPLSASSKEAILAPRRDQGVKFPDSPIKFSIGILVLPRILLYEMQLLLPILCFLGESKFLKCYHKFNFTFSCTLYIIFDKYQWEKVEKKLIKHENCLNSLAIFKLLDY